MFDRDAFSRRRVLRGMLGGSAVMVGLPLLECFLNGNGTALANGAQLPMCFGTWFVGLGFNRGRWEPKQLGAGYDMNVELACLQPFKEKINIYSGLRAFTDGRPNQVHTTGQQIIISGSAAKDSIQPTLDVLMADAIGSTTRFRSLEVSCDGTGSSNSRRSAQVTNPAEISPLKLYTRIFGVEFQDPNAADFKPDPRLMVRRSVLSAITDSRNQMASSLGAADKQRLDQYFTSLRELEQSLDIQLQKPVPMRACTKVSAPEDANPNTDVNNALTNNKLFAKLLAHALACNQTRVFNIAFSRGASDIRAPGDPTSVHVRSHEDPFDPVTGVQTKVSELQMQCITGYRDVLAELNGIQEGAGTLLDRTVVLYFTDTGSAAVHGLDNIPMFTAGGANGRLKTGVHIQSSGDTVARVGFTIQHAMGLSPGSWGTESNMTSKPFSEVLV